MAIQKSKTAAVPRGRSILLRFPLDIIRNGNKVVPMRLAVFILDEMLPRLQVVVQGFTRVPLAIFAHIMHNDKHIEGRVMRQHAM